MVRPACSPSCIGEAVAKYFVWDAIRAVDYLISRPEVDPARIGAMGCSGGGTITALTAALDHRIAATGVACYTTSFDELLLAQIRRPAGWRAVHPRLHRARRAESAARLPRLDRTGCAAPLRGPRHL